VSKTYVYLNEINRNNYDNGDDVDREFSNRGSTFDEKALRDEIHKDIGSEKVSYKFDD